MYIKVDNRMFKLSPEAGVDNFTKNNVGFFTLPVWTVDELKANILKLEELGHVMFHYRTLIKWCHNFRWEVRTHILTRKWEHVQEIEFFIQFLWISFR